MGLLIEGLPLSWEETQKYAEHVKKDGLAQFVNIYQRSNKSKESESLKWGDEIEYSLIKFDHFNKRAQVCLRADELLTILRKPEMDNISGLDSLWRPEYSAYVVEGTPGQPYGSSLSDLNTVEINMKSRRKAVRKLLQNDETVMSIGNFPRHGCPDFTYPETMPPTPNSGILRSKFVSDEVIQGHPRWPAITRHANLRRGANPNIQVPIFRDKNTPNPFIEKGIEEQQPNMIYMDCFEFGWGLCCLQATFQAQNLSQARVLYDNLAVICPIMMALTAATPFHRGYISDVDCRWNLLSIAADCRNAKEREPGGIPKSRYDSIDLYLCPENNEFNDVRVVYSEEHLKMLLNSGIDLPLAKHIAHFFARDPLCIFSDMIHQDNEKESVHFETIHSTNWQTMRLKPPNVAQEIGWRVEFRPCEIQLTDFENATIVCFLNLLARIVLSLDLSCAIPISKVDANMKTAQVRNACLEQKFWFRNNIQSKDDKEYSLMTVDNIINGSENFVGLIPLIRSYLNLMEVESDTQLTIQKYLGLISKRAKGEVMTAATWMRDFVSTHPAYGKDSVINEEINYDLLVRINQLSENPCPKLLGDLWRSCAMG